MPALLGFRAAALAVLAALVATATLTSAAPASATSPVAVDDYRSMYPGQVRLVNVLRNDADADGDQLAICRLGEVDADRYYAEIVDGRLLVAPFGDSLEDIVITYYACDFDTLVPATLTVSLREIFPMRIVKLDRPGRLRVTNDNDRVVRFLYGSFREERPDGRVKVLPNDSVVIRVHRHRIDWVAYMGRDIVVGIGHVRDIELPAGDDGSARTRPTLSRAEVRMWAKPRP